MWCGARNGRCSISPSAWRPATLWIRVTSIASSRLIGGRIDGRRRASIVLPGARARPRTAGCARRRRRSRSASSGVRCPRTSSRSGRRVRSTRLAAPPAPDGDRAPAGEDLGRRAQVVHGGDRQARRRAPPRAPRWRGTSRRLSAAVRAPSATASAPGRVAQLAGERELAEDRPRCEARRRDLAARREHGEGERGVEAGADLAQERRGEVGGDALVGELEPGVLDRGAHALARLAHGGVAEADDGERRQPGTDVDLDPHLARIDPVDGERGGAAEHAGDATPRWCDVCVARGAKRVPIRRRLGHRLAHDPLCAS